MAQVPFLTWPVSCNELNTPDREEGFSGEGFSGSHVAFYFVSIIRDSHTGGCMNAVLVSYASSVVR